MKKLIFISMAIIAIMTTSCTEDFTNPANLVGTIWKATDFSKSPTFTDENLEYVYFKFTSATNVEGWQKTKNTATESNSGSATYSISGKTITFNAEGNTTTGTIEGNKITYTMGGSGEYVVFVKQ